MPLEVRALGVTRSARRQLDRVSFAAADGEILAVVGPNGAGKTTLLEAIGGLLPHEGEVWVGGEVLRTFRQRARRFASMPDDAELPAEVSVRTLLASTGQGGADAPSALAVGPLRDRSAGELSRGEAKRVWLALTLALGRSVLLLDEPFGAFDPIQLDDVVAAVRAHAAKGATVIVSVHDLVTAEHVADRVLLLAEGRVVACGTLGELRARAGTDERASLDRVFRALLGERARGDAGEVDDAPP